MSSRSQEPDDLLIIDDHPGEIRLIEEIVETADIETTLYIASDKEEARDIIHQPGEYDADLRPDAILLDWNLEKGTAREVLTEIKDTLPHTSVAIMTSAKHQKEKIQSEGPQADMYFTKPDSPQGYIDAIYEIPAEE
ncbi:response regulator [Halomicrobium urmianum]|uniref:response regulator n=1 Tax=Halomicrobium urmianum TaxID=1586233 RepID=UPI001CD996C8|nr:response regulator [Halomicrobium urmianum]